MNFLSKLFGGKENKNEEKSVLDNIDSKNLSKEQHNSLKLIKKKEMDVLKKSKISKTHPNISKKLKEIEKNIPKIKSELKRSSRVKKSEKMSVSNAKLKKVAEGKKKIKENPLDIKKDGAVYFKTFVPGFDDLVDPGLPVGSAILVEGGPGSGKTLWCLTMLREMCKRKKKVLFMSFEEQEDRLRAHINAFGLNAQEYEKKGLLYLKRFNALDISRSVEALLSEAKKELLIEVQPVLIPPEFKPDIVIIDSLSSISSAFSGDPSRFRIYMEQLFRYLEGHNITSFLIREVGSPTHLGVASGGTDGEAVSFLSDGIIAVYSVIYDNGLRKRAMEVLKMRGVKIDRKICEYQITGKGVIVDSKKILKGKYTLA